MSTYFVCCFTGSALPVIGVGLLSSLTNATTADVAFACTIAAFALVALIFGVVYRRSQPLFLVDAIGTALPETTRRLAVPPLMKESQEVKALRDQFPDTDHPRITEHALLIGTHRAGVRYVDHA